MKKLIIWSLVTFSISCASIDAPSSIIVNKDENKVIEITNVPVNNTNPIPKSTSGQITIKVINTSGKSIQSVEISAMGNYFGMTDFNGEFVMSMDYGKNYYFTLYHGQYKTSYETHVVNEGDTTFTSMLTRIQ